MAKYSTHTSQGTAQGTDQLVGLRSTTNSRWTFAVLGAYVRGLFTTTPATIAEGGTNSSTASAARTALGVDAAGDSRPPSGGAGGVLSGTYPNPGFAVDMATQAELNSEANARSTADGILAQAITDETTRATNAEALKADKTTTISAAGLVTGGGSLAANRTLTVTAATGAEAITGTETGKAMTPAADKAALDAKVDPIANSRAAKQALVFDGTASSRFSSSIAGPGTGDFDYEFVLIWDDVAGFIVAGVTNSVTVLIGSTGIPSLYKNGDLAPTLTASSALVSGKVHRLGISRASSVSTIKLDGVSIGSGADANNYSAPLTTIGALDGNAVPFKGTIYDFLPYNYALSAAQVARLFATGAPDAVDRGGSITALNTTTFTNSGYSAFSGASAIGFTAAISGGDAFAYSNPRFSARVGQRFKVTFTVAFVSGSLNQVGLSVEGVSVNSDTFTPGSTDGTYTYTLTCGTEASNVGLFFRAGTGSFTISGVSVIPLGTLAQYDANQPGVGPQWREVNGTTPRADIILPGDGVTGGVSWLLPGSQSAEISCDIAGTSGNSFVLGADVQRIPTGWAIIAARVYTPIGQGAANITLGYGSGGTQIATSTAVVANGYVDLSLAATKPVFVDGLRLYMNRSATLDAGSKLILTIQKVD